jgi:4-diphosphocytidyl-2-C-methyl-D-erythritol kinase
MSETRRAYAKINLALYIVNRLPNGYHALETLFAPVNWYDTLTFTPSETIEMTCSNLALPIDASNLCLKAARALAALAHEKKFGIHIHLEKNIPFGAGLGGGSSDAACVLNYLNGYWHLNLAPDALHRIAVTLGADVPYFLNSQSGIAFATGIGDDLTYLNQRFPFAIVTAFPNEPVSTVWAYKNLRLHFPRPAPDCRTALHQAIQQRDVKFLDVFENDFESAVFAAYPKVKELKAEFRRQGGSLALMSGSGGAVFGVFESPVRAEACFKNISERYPASLTPPDFSPV